MTLSTLVRAPVDGCGALNLPTFHQEPSMGPLGILWDMENCPIPGDVQADEIARNIRMALSLHPGINRFVTIFSAYGDFNEFPRRLREGCQRTGINLIDVPNGRKDASDKAIIVDMFLFALDNPPPCSILLISGDVDFSPALHKLGQRGYTVYLVLPGTRGIASSLCNASRYVWDWPSLARGRGFVPVIRRRHIMDNSRIGKRQPRGDFNPVSNGCPSLHKSRDNFLCFRSGADSTRTVLTQKKSSIDGMQVTDLKNTEDQLWVRPGDINGLKNQLVNLLMVHGGMIKFTRVTAEYKRLFGRPLYLSEYGSLKLAELLGKLGNTFKIVSAGNNKMVIFQDDFLREQLSEKNDMCHKNIENHGESAFDVQEECADDDIMEEIILLHAKDEPIASD
ncbi:hypothetical protein KP509_37G053400 [Ceratopteris richardii]|uniref:HTH OST-type domain-containing protein n=1 Tax=Ceratopteris richardii TaxID=49495 RepID=A0A8T2Q7W1_CERRI|nr:hypothetical protein KP509_37G053400 [Ceratopteris richardii]KAH7280135.1 hypothetical protein KP509_37G053400 [Ceratopteris richardii]KAH7280136.1 hypothetical protein KP509_37G053400 [Ceratopteris richardii]KAH7280137.1 hypothetical protein KP509_37G053400 [Ceratopteris richardii]